MPTLTTLNEIVRYYREFAEAHNQLNDFYIGLDYDASTTRQLKMPYLRMSYLPSSIEISNKVQIPLVSLNFFVPDQWNNQDNITGENGLDSNNTQEVMSDTWQILQDLIQYTLNNLRKKDVKLDDASYSIEPAYDETPDKVFGWQLTLTLRLKHSSCELPGDFTNLPT